LDAHSDTSDEPQKSLKRDKFGLNDGFFSIDEFNKRTEMLERQDAVGQPDADAASDEEDIDWNADPTSIQIPDDAAEGSTDDNGDEEAGPTFGNMDLFAPEGASDEENLEHDQDEFDVDKSRSNATNLKYADFFDPPAHKNKKSKSKSRSGVKDRSRTNGEKGATEDESDFEERINRTISAIHRDLFSDESEAEDDQADIQADPGASNHERRKAAILAQIRELEALNVAKRPWTLSGEATGKDRPVNAILEEELDFERTGKPLPIITAETSEEIEQLIKRRILAGEFDEVRRRRPDEALLSVKSKSRRLEDELLDVPKKRGLAEVYEEEHLRRTDPAYVDKKTERLNKEHAEIEALWKDIVTKLDSLASWRYRPKPAEVTVSVRSDAPAMSLEDARPSGVGGEVGTLAQLAPQEVYKPGDVKEQGKVVTKGGNVLDRAELSQENRKRQRRREKERIKKSQAKGQGHISESGKQKNASTLTKDLKKSGVKVIGRKGELRDVEGNEVKQGPRLLSSNLKL
jgi:U3 small nucleolar RNA-associated protein MPP10